MDSSHFLEEDVPDPTDFPQTAPGLFQLDDALRCHVCRELFQAPVTVNCPSGHCFCSSCIRTAISQNPVCPLCRETINEIHLRRNQAMEDAVKAWTDARQFVLDLVRSDELRTASSVSSTPASIIVPSTPSRKRRKITPGSEIADEERMEVSTPKKTRLGSAKPARSQSEEAQSSSAAASKLVICPICNKSVLYAKINKHMDKGCPSPTPSELEDDGANHASSSKSKQSEEWKKLLGSSAKVAGTPSSKAKGKLKAKATSPDTDDFEEPLPKVAYDTLSVRRIREMLQAVGLPNTGDKPALIARHQRYTILYNANRDASPTRRKTLRQLREEVRKWEETTAEDKRKKSKAADIDAVAYQQKHKDTFAKLTEAARRTGKNAAVSTNVDASPPASDIQMEGSAASQPSGVPPIPTQSTVDSTEDVITIED